MKVKVIKRFVDKYTNEFYKLNQILDISKDRYNEIRQYVDIIEKKENKKSRG